MDAGLSPARPCHGRVGHWFLRAPRVDLQEVVHVDLGDADSAVPLLKTVLSRERLTARLHPPQPEHRSGKRRLHVSSRPG